MEKTAFICIVILLSCKIASAQWLSVPFAKEDAAGIKITEGWIYSQEEQRIHGYTDHKAVDFASRVGTKVYAAADGWAVYSFHSRLIPGRMWQGKAVGFGLGHFVQIWHSEQKRYTCYGHLSYVERHIPYLDPVQDSKQPHDFDPKAVYLPNGVIPKGALEVHRGDLIGYVGTSGLTWDYTEFPSSGPDDHQSWDEPHLHFEVYTRGADGKKDRWYDPFCLYSDAKEYNPENPVSVAGLWLFDINHRLVWAK